MEDEEAAFKKSDSSISPLRTYKSDFSAFAKEKNIGKVEMVAAEIKRGGQQAEEFASARKANPLLMLLIVAAVGVAGYLGYLFFTAANKPLPVKQHAQIPAPLIFSEKQDEIFLKDATRSELEGAIRREIQKPFALDNIVYVPIIKEEDLKETYVDLPGFLATAQINPPTDLVSALEGSYMFGLFSRNERYPILILKIKLYENAFAGMIGWENKIADDLGKIWPVKKVTASDKFKDQTAENHDLRQLNDADGNLVLVYSFLNRDTLAITTSEEAMNEIFKRFTFR